MSSEYEFTPPQERVIGGMVQAMTVVAVFYFLLAVLMGLAAAMGGFLMFIPAVIFGVLGVRLWDARKAMTVVVTTEGEDIQHFMVAMINIRGYFKITGVLFILLAALVLVVLLLAGGASSQVSMRF